MDDDLTDITEGMTDLGEEMSKTGCESWVGMMIKWFSGKLPLI